MSKEVRCNKCKHNPKRLFDVVNAGKGTTISIKCSKCGSIITVKLNG